jgi:hypothetical protein
MADAFDPYYKWLGIPPQEQPPNHYRLLAINLFESDADVIEAAADRQMSHLRSYQTGKHSAESQKLLNECAAARVALLNPQKKADYDGQLGEKLAAASSVGNALSGVPSGADTPGRGEGVSPRSVPRAKALPQPQPSRATHPAPLIDVGASSPLARRSAHPRTKKQAWLVPIASMAGAIALALVLWIVLRPSGPSELKNRERKTAANRPKTTVAISNSKHPPTTLEKDRAAPPPIVAPPAPSASSDSAVAPNTSPREGSSEALDYFDSNHRDDGKYIDLVLAPGVTMRLLKIPASADGKIKSFYLGQTEVTQKQWQAVMGSNPSQQKASDLLPVHDIRYEDCLQFLERLSPKSKRLRARLPSKDEWFHAYEAGDPGAAHRTFGPAALDYAWSKENAGGSYAYHEVATKKPKSWGLYDMLGNGWEWIDGESIVGIGVFDSTDEASVRQRIVERTPIHPVEPLMLGTATVRVAADIDRGGSGPNHAGR